jgi:hypothetical protein
MNLKSYFDAHEGIGILATCDPNAAVNMALYAKPLVINQTTIALVMRQQLSHQNLRSFPRASYMFIEKGKNHLEYNGIRLYLTVQREEINQSAIEAMHKKEPWIYPEGDDAEKYLVFFSVTHIRPLVGNGPIA